MRLWNSVAETSFVQKGSPNVCPFVPLEKNDCVSPSHLKSKASFYRWRYPPTSSTGISIISRRLRRRLDRAVVAANERARARSSLSTGLFRPRSRPRTVGEGKRLCPQCKQPGAISRRSLKGVGKKAREEKRMAPVAKKFIVGVGMSVSSVI